jgi:hypothetical protein
MLWGADSMSSNRYECPMSLIIILPHQLHPRIQK